MSGLVDKAKNMLGSKQSENTTQGTEHHAGTTTAAHNTHNTHAAAGGIQSGDYAAHGAPVTHEAGAVHSETHRTGPVHQNETLNKLDPRVHKTTNTTAAPGAAVPLDAARVPPSVMQQHVGRPSVEHEFPHDSKDRRHSVTHQEEHMLK